MALKQSWRWAITADQEVTGSSVLDGAWRDHVDSSPITRPGRPPTAAVELEPEPEPEPRFDLGVAF